MRYNERELLSLARQPAEKAAEIRMSVPKKGNGEGESARGRERRGLSGESGMGLSGQDRGDLRGPGWGVRAGVTGDGLGELWVLGNPGWETGSSGRTGVAGQ